MRSGFFENTAVMAEDFARFARGLLTNGVLADTDTALKVSPGSGMRVSVAPGYCWINGHFGVVETAETLVIAPSDGTLGRKDRVVARLDLSAHEIRLEVITGEASATPTAPNVVRSGNYYDLGLAVVNVPAGTLEITQLNLTDTRSDAEVCGGVIYRNADAMALDGKANKSDLINPFSLPYRNLGDAFEKEIAEFGGDAYAWIKSRILANNIDDIYLGDYLPSFTVEWDGETYDYTPRVWRMGKAILPGETAYIDFMCDELWFYPIPWNKADYALGLNITGNTTYGDVVINSGYLSSYLHHCLNGVEGYYVDVSGSSNVLAYFTPPAGGDAGQNVVNLFPTYVRNNIIEKIKYTPTIYFIQAATQPYGPGTSNVPRILGANNGDNKISKLNVGKLWLPTMTELFGARVAGAIGYNVTQTYHFLPAHLQGTHEPQSLTWIEPIYVNKIRYIVPGLTYENEMGVFTDEPSEKNNAYQELLYINYDFTGKRSGSYSSDWKAIDLYGKEGIIASTETLPLICFTF